MRHLFPIMFLCFMIAACGEKSDDAEGGDECTECELECGEGTHEEDGFCVVDEEAPSDAGDDGGDDGGDDDGDGDDGAGDDTGASDDTGAGDDGDGDDGDGDDGDGDDGGTGAEVMPEVGSWHYTSFSVTSTTCAGASDDVVTGLSESTGFSISDTTASGFVWQIDGFPEPSACTQSGFDFNCAPVSGNIDNDFVELPTIITTQGNFSDERTLSGTYEATINCSGLACETVELLYAISFPCDFDFSFSASPI
jgi:hypothetical protein